ncbi:hypothetical protein CBR_g31307 [Chara braunii]|uniref:Cellulose synthase n=1 Tax=Chara braunii TaxID=69332 RepID=A0A388LEW1_CHABU|nr:hypothetical protein CBR_g31307 [Chara braunii]|eukprot:GBG80752.1 hypothetical protein CBR_g31307 [Chara braunii]
MLPRSRLDSVKKPPKPSLLVGASPARGAPFESPDLSMEGPSSGEVHTWSSQDNPSGRSSSSMSMSFNSAGTGHMRTPSMENMIVLGSYTKNTLEVTESSGADEKRYDGDDKDIKCQICRERVGRDDKGEPFVPCECAFPVCRQCYEYIRENEGGLCPQCHEPYTRMKGSPQIQSDPLEALEMGIEEGTLQPLGMADKQTTVLKVVDNKAQVAALMKSQSMKALIEGPPPEEPADAKSLMDEARAGSLSVVPIVPKASRGYDPVTSALMSIQILDPTKNMDDYGYGSICWVENDAKASMMGAPAGGGGGGGGEKGSGTKNIVVDDTRRPLARVIPIAGNSINPYRFMIIVRFAVLCLFLKWRVLNPNNGAFVLWLLSVICEVWFGVSWILDQAPKWAPVTRETYLDRLSLRFERPGEPSKLLPVDVFITTADPEKEPPLVTANVVLSVLAMDYPVDKIACYLSDDGAAMLTFEALTETASFARAWVPFCKKHEIEPRAPEMYFQQKVDYTKGKTQSDFIKERRHMKRAYDEFKVRINALVAKSRDPPEDGWKMNDNSPWPGNDRKDHVGMIQVFLQPDGDTKFWVIGGTSAHLAAVTQGLLKVVFRVDISFTLTQKGSDDDDDPYAELYAFRWTWLMVPPTTIMITNIIACFAGVSREMYKGRSEQNWGRLVGMVFFSFWVLTHLYPFAKGLMGKTNKTPTIVIVWSILLAIVLSLLWVHVLAPHF